MTRTLLVALLSTAIAPVIYATDVTGHWLATTRAPDGAKRETSLWLKLEDGTFTGYMSGRNQDDAAVSEAKVNGSDISFAVVRDEYGEPHKTQYSGMFSGDDLTLHMPGPNGRTRDLVFKHVSTDPPGPLPAPRPKLMLPPAVNVAYNGLAKTPPMGWNSWNKFKREVSDKLVRETADAMAGNGMKAAGYLYINVDDTWQAGRDAEGNILTNDRFPDMKALGDYIHSKGLKFGIYSSPGPKTCADYEGSFKHEAQDAKTYASWGVDYLKYDWCSAPQVYDYHSMQAAYAMMGAALQASGRPILYSLCQYGLLKSERWAASVGGNSWRTTGDISDNWQSMSHIGFDLQADLAPYSGPGHWNDPDMLEVGNGGMSDTEYQTHMSLWSLLASPLLAGNDLRAVPANVMEILANAEVIAIDQDPLGKQASRVSKDGDLEVWARPLADGSYAVGLFNRSAGAATVSARWKDVGFSGSAAVRDLWAHAARGESVDSFSAVVPPHGVVLVKVQKKTHSQ